MTTTVEMPTPTPHLLSARFDLLLPDVRNRCRLVLVGEKWEGWTAPEQAIAASLNADRIEFIDRYVT